MESTRTKLSSIPLYLALAPLPRTFSGRDGPSDGSLAVPGVPHCGGGGVLGKMILARVCFRSRLNALQFGQ